MEFPKDWWVWILILVTVLLYVVVWPVVWIMWIITKNKELEYEHEDWPRDSMEDFH
jgi:hypothetical protein